MTITTVGIDLAKNVFAVHCVDQNGKTVLVKSRVTRAALPGLIAGLPPCVIGMEETATYNRLRGLISEFGVIAPQSTDALRHIVFEQKNSLPLQVQQCVDDLLEHVARIEDNIAEYDRILSRMAKTDHRSQRLMELKGVGPTTACALVASIGNAHDFKNGRQLAAWLGLTPSQYSSGGKSKLGRITKAGDSYLRTLLVQGARSVLIGAEKRTDLFSRWVCSLVERRGYWRAVVAIAAKNARLCWASLHYGDDFRLYSAS
ncbi:IS110 family transposase [Escherichia coli]|uniref:IS110 family transposase n=1 Tax=Escherichia coli TaxID=562 RepID=UPI00345A75A1